MKRTVESKGDTSKHTTEDQRAIDKFQEILRIRSISVEGPQGSYAASIKFLTDYANSLGLCSSEVIELVPGHPILVITWEGANPQLKSILLNGHYDVVPAEESKWMFDPFSGHRTEDGNIYGRGAQDMKCVLIQYLEAVGRLFQAVKNGKIDPPKRTIHISFLPDEEIAGITGAAKFVTSQKFQGLNAGVALDEGLANPGDAYTIFYGERAPWWVKITAEGPAGHGSRFIPRAAIEKLSGVLQKAHKFRSDQEAKLHPSNEAGCAHAQAKKLGDVITLNVTAVKGYVDGPEFADGFAVNCIPIKAIAAMDVRIPPSVPMEEVENMLKEWTSEEGLHYEFYAKMPKHHVTSTDSTNPWWASIQNSCGKIGKKLELEIFPAATDSRYFRAIELPCFGFSPVNLTPVLLHDHNEFLNEEVFLEGVRVYERLIYDLANVENSK